MWMAPTSPGLSTHDKCGIDEGCDEVGLQHRQTRYLRGVPEDCEYDASGCGTVLVHVDQQDTIRQHDSTDLRAVS